MSGDRFAPVVGYGRGRALLSDELERQLRQQEALHHRREVVEVAQTPAEGFPAAVLSCGHVVRCSKKLRLPTKLPCPECAA